MVSVFALKLLPNITNDELLVIYSVLALIFVGIWIFLVIPNLLKKGQFIFRVDEDKVYCLLPDGDQFEMKISEIAGVEKARSMTRDQYVDYWLISKEGKDQLIPAIFGLSPHNVVKALSKVKSDLAVCKSTNY